MAQTIFHFIGTPPPLLLPSNSKLQLRRNHVFQCQCFSNTSSNSNSNGSAPNSRRKSSNSETETTPILKAAVSAVTELLRLFSPSNQASSLSQDTEEFRDEFPLSSVDDVLNIIQSDYDKAYFVTGRELYARNLKLLVPFFDCASIRLQKIEKDVDSETNFVLATWKLRTNLNLPWRPLISIDGSTYYELDKDFKIVRHVESWNVSALEAILQIFTFTSEITGV
ncbi:hypothetical protein AAHE18_U069500 [Arachis hypogaea]